VALCGDGLAAGTDLVEAARAAVATALAPLEGAIPDLMVVFVAGDDPEACEAALLAAHEFAGARTSLGCSAAGVIGGGRALVGVPAVSVWAAQLPGSRIRSFHLEVLRTKEAWAVVGTPPPRDRDVVGLLLADPWSFPAGGFVAASEQAMGSLPLVGGLANGPRGSGSTRLMVDGVIHDRGAVGATISNAVAQTLVSPGHRPFGAPMTVTGSLGSVVTSLAGAPAAERLAEAIAELPEPDQVLAARGVMLGVAIDEYVEDHGVDEVVVRTILEVDTAHGALEMHEAVQVGTTVRFCLVDPQAASAYFMDNLVGLRVEPGVQAADGALLMACVDRYAGAPDALEDDVNALIQVSGAAGVAGMVTGGEIGPAPQGNQVHGLTSTVVLLSGSEVVSLPTVQAPSRPVAGGRA
jgi:small ligand-binding sensory domain FIST